MTHRMVGWVASFALACDAPTEILSTSILANTFDPNGPYQVVAVVRDPDGVDRVDLVFRSFAAPASPAQEGQEPGGFEAPARMGSGDDGAGDEEEGSEVAWLGAIPGPRPVGSTVQYFVEAQDGDDLVTDPPGARDDEPVTFAFAVIAPFAACLMDDDCGPGELCDEAFCSPSTATCANDTDCPNGYACDGVGRCRPRVRACGADTDCLISELCDGDEGLCAARPTCGDGAAAGVCPDGLACGDAGICVRACGDGDPCEGGGACVDGRCRDQPRAEGAGPCAACGADADCGGVGDYCLTDAGRGVRYCGRACAMGNAGDCPAGFSCREVANPPQCAPDDAAACPF